MVVILTKAENIQKIVKKKKKKSKQNTTSIFF